MEDFFLRLPKILLRIKIYLHLQSSGHSHCDRQLCVSGLRELRGELQRLIGLLFMFVLLGLSGEKKSFLAFSNNFRHLFF